MGVAALGLDPSDQGEISSGGSCFWQSCFMQVGGSSCQRARPHEESPAPSQVLASCLRLHSKYDRQKFFPASHFTYGRGQSRMRMPSWRPKVSRWLAEGLEGMVGGWGGVFGFECANIPLVPSSLGSRAILLTYSPSSVQSQAPLNSGYKQKPSMR